MADSFVDLDIEGPITAYGKYTVKPEHIDDFSEVMRQYAERIRAGKQPYLTSIDVFRHENVFVTAAKFESVEGVEIATRDAPAIFSEAFKNFLAEEPELKFFGTYSATKP